MMSICDVLTEGLLHSYYGIAFWRYAVAFAIIIASFFVKRLFQMTVMRAVLLGIARTPLKSSQKVVEALGKPFSALILVGGFFLAIVVLGVDGAIPPAVLNFLNTSYFVAIGVVIVWAVYRLADLFCDYLEKVLAKRHETFDEQLVPLIRKSLKGFVLLVGSIAILSTFNILGDIGSLFAGLGIGGLAVALAAQDALGNFFGSVALLSDKPFKVGDWIEVGDKVNGFVETVGLRSTTVRTWSKSLVTIPNKVLAGEIINNQSRMPKRRVQQTIGISYETTSKQLQELLDKLEVIIRDDEGTDPEYVMVRFTEFGAYSLEILIVYFTKSIRRAEHLAVKQRVNLKIMDSIKAMGLSIAFPTQTLYFEGDVARQMGLRH